MVEEIKYLNAKVETPRQWGFLCVLVRVWRGFRLDPLGCIGGAYFVLSRVLTGCFERQFKWAVTHSAYVMNSVRSTAEITGFCPTVLCALLGLMITRGLLLY